MLYLRNDYSITSILISSCYAKNRQIIRLSRRAGKYEFIRPTIEKIGNDFSRFRDSVICFTAQGIEI